MRWLSEQEAEQKWLVFLVPSKHCLPVQEGKVGEIRIGLRLWEDVLKIIENYSEDADPLLQEFGKLLKMQLQPLRFTVEETEMLFSRNFPANFRAVRKLEDLVDEIQRRARSVQAPSSGREKEDEDTEDEYGVTFRNANGQEVLWFGIWARFCEDHGHPLCFAIRNEWKKAVPNLEAVFTTACQGQTECFANNWIVSWCPDSALKADLPVEKVWFYLKPILESVTRAGSNESSGV